MFGITILCSILVNILASSIKVFPSTNLPENVQVNLTCILNVTSKGAIFILPRKNCEINWPEQSCVQCTSQTCQNNRTFIIERKVNKYWNNFDVKCDALFGNDMSEAVNFNITVSVTSVNLTLDQTAVIVNQQINLTCTTDYCNPAANITWYKASIPVENNIIQKIETEKSNNLKKTISVLTYTGLKEDNKKPVYCKASNLISTVNSDMHSLVVSYPPSSEPVIFPSSPGGLFNSGANATLTCQLSGGNPLANLTFNCTGKKLKEFNQSNSTTAISVLSFEIDSSFNNRTCTCIVKHPALDKIVQTSITLTVNVRVTRVDLTIDQTAVNVNQLINLTCTTDYCNPAATITWYKASTPIMSYIIQYNETDYSNYLKKTTSVLTYTGATEDNMKLVYCTATNVISAVNSTIHQLDVRYPPTSYPVISTNVSNFEFDDGAQVTIICELNGGNPLATLVFTCNNLNGADANVGNKTAVSVLSLVVDKYYNNKQCLCLAKHQLFNNSRSKTETITVFYNNIIVSEFKEVYKINESQKFQLKCSVDGNPLSNITWIFAANGSVIKMENYTNMSILKIDSANCLDFGLYEVMAENRKESTASLKTKLAVNCKPRQYPGDLETPDKFGVGSNQSLRISTRILLYPNSDFVEWKFTRKVNENIIISNDSLGFTIKNIRGENEENITLSKENVVPEDFGNYTVIVRNAMGVFERKYQVSSARSPLPPINLTLVCDNPFSITLSWIADFNGGDKQIFHVFFSFGEKNSSFKELATVDDQGFGQIHSYSPAEKLYGQLWFRIAASNMFGNSTTGAIPCFIKTPDESPSNVAMLAGITAGGGVCLAFVVIVVVVYFRKYYKNEKSVKHIERLNNENEEDGADVDGLKENSLYVSAGPRDDEKPEVAVYAAVVKKLPQSDNNSNLYADVKKSGRQDTNKGTMSSEVKPKKGLFKKDGKAKHKKGKKPKNRPGEADVYENSEDIAMSTNVDNVYSNAGQKGLNKQEERGYKNKDGLLYVEVNFDGKQGQDNPFIHGEDEKTDYATVEFPMPSALHKASGSEEL